MVVDHSAPVVIMLCSLNEEKVNHLKTDETNFTPKHQTLVQYWPKKDNTIAKFGEFHIESTVTKKLGSTVKKELKIMQEVGRFG